MAALSSRLATIVDALPLRPGLRVIEIGCGPGVAARAVAERVGPHGHVLAIDRSAKAIAQLTKSAGELIAEGRLTARCIAAEELALDERDARYDIASAVRVGAFDVGTQAPERRRSSDLPAHSFLVAGSSSMVAIPFARSRFGPSRDCSIDIGSRAHSTLSMRRPACRLVLGANGRHEEGGRRCGSACFEPPIGAVALLAWQPGCP